MLGRLRELGQEAPAKWFKRKPPETAKSSREEAVKERAKEGYFCDPDSKLACITVCSPNADCTCDAAALKQAFEDEISRQKLPFSVGNAKVGCGGKCEKGPFIGFPQKGFFYLGVRPEDVPEVVEYTLVRGKILFPFLSINPDRSFRNDIYYERKTGLIGTMDDKTCMVQVAKYFLDFEEGLSCGKCVPCRLGMKRMQESIDRIATGQGTEQDIEQVKGLCETMIDVPHCDFAVTSSRPVLSALTYFADEFNAHVQKKECPAGVCKELVELQRKLALRRRREKKKK